MSFSRPSNAVEPEYGFTTSDQGFVVLDHEYIVNDLEVLIDSNLTFDEHYTWENKCCKQNAWEF